MGLNYQYINLEAVELFQYLNRALFSVQNVSKLMLSDVTYSLSFVYSGDFGRIGMAIDIYEN
jgi:hypothetical protein